MHFLVKNSIDNQKSLLGIRDLLQRYLEDHVDDKRPDIKKKIDAIMGEV